VASRSGDLVDWLLRDRRTGEIVIAQAPNPALWVVIVTWALRLALDPAGRWRTGLVVVGTVALVWWAGDEVLRGVNPWRRILGGVVLGAVALGSVR
jgi:hypothetical protein